MNAAFLVAADEWRFWLRSKLGLAAIILALLVTVTSLVANASRISAAAESRAQLQAVAEETFKNQPARHPHRMVHYGHYVFRAPAPLAVVDPGVDPYTGTVMFLEGHHQNSATFAPFFSAAQAGVFARLTPAMTYQVLIPLVLIIVGFASLAREREGGTDRQLLTSGLAPCDLWLGKVLALAGLGGLLLLPLAFVSIQALSMGEGAGAVSAFLLGYAVYLLIWALLIAAVSAGSRQASGALLTLMSLWLLFCVVAPPFAASVATASAPMASKIETDLAVAKALRTAGDGHNANDPAFNRLRSNLFEQYGVDRVEDLPVNFRGVVAEAAEADLTDTMNSFADETMQAEMAQSSIQQALSFISPQLAVRHFSMSLAGTDLRQHHRFLHEAENARFDFVQGLNRVHAEELSYDADINRNASAEAGQRARVSAENWRVLNAFSFEPAPAGQRLASATPYLFVLAVWTALCAFVGISRAKDRAEAADA
ncbi:MAG: DUF3526 domain-containing protein [Pseudomonadota bacterium]